MAWIVEKFRTWSDCGGDVESRFTKDELLTNVSLYWFNQNITSSTRLYYETMGPFATKTFHRGPVKACTQLILLLTGLCFLALCMSCLPFLLSKNVILNGLTFCVCLSVFVRCVCHRVPRYLPALGACFGALYGFRIACVAFCMHASQAVTRVD